MPFVVSHFKSNGKEYISILISLSILKADASSDPGLHSQRFSSVSDDDIRLIFA